MEKTSRPDRLPPGQVLAPLRRFGLPRYAGVRPLPGNRPVVSVAGAVGRPTQLDVAGSVPGSRRRQRSDLHCVTTWSAVDLLWEGVPFRAVHDLVAARVGVAEQARWVVFRGLDGYRACLRLDDVLGEDVLLADRLDGAPLTVDHGAPLRLVAPSLYGYKSVKHIHTIEYRRAYDPGPAGWAVHPRGRVRCEERSRFLPGRVWRVIWRGTLPGVRNRYARE